MQEEGKLYTECEGPSCDDTNARGLGCQPSGSLTITRSAAAGSSGVDVETAVDITLVDAGVHLVDSNIKGPLGFGLSAFLMGRSSTALKGILVVPGFIDADYCGTVKIMIHVVIPPVSIPKGTRIAQLVPFRSCVPNPGEVQRGDGGFGSTGKPQVYFAMDITRDTGPRWTPVRFARPSSSGAS
ncbi:deoxyuridine 5'-triphosphate nucleotidohydrolase-like isoform X2 [Accipiter gentilis]|uniref:deoxyuridine 5'-triphosphate nucleotidohydrolase-like isoform X2 n=1 Tax=Astur gentilis TaxID=8957 RepID=UPI002110DA92|nr:deoxyuridine 5'-triphosphate nucleotidohydrolase-like isoform X2 [Accipiter gentilis]